MREQAELRVERENEEARCECEVRCLSQSIGMTLRQRSRGGGIFPPECGRKLRQSLWVGWTLPVQGDDVLSKDLEKYNRLKRLRVVAVD